jgi:LysR family glycine cleavage system transcriptional activator
VRLSESGRRLLPAITGGFASIAEAFAALRGEDDDVLALATPAPGLAASASASVQACACLAHPPLA